MSKLLAGVLIVGMVVGIVMLWPRENPASPTTTIAVASEGSTTTMSTPTTTVAATSTSTTAAVVESREVTTVEEAEAILRELWFGWFEGIYNQDEDRIREVVATEELLDSALASFGTMTFENEPSLAGIAIGASEILHSDEGCLAVWARVSAVSRDGGSEGVQVLRAINESWRLMSVWIHRDDLWIADCESQLSPLS